MDQELKNKLQKNAEKENDNNASSSIDYSKEFGSLNEGGDSDRAYVKMKPRTKVKFKILEEPERDQHTFEGDDEPTHFLNMKIEILEGELEERGQDNDREFEPGHEEDLFYKVNQATTVDSQYGQFMAVGHANDGLKGQEVTVQRIGSGTSTVYLIEEAQELLQEMKGEDEE